VKMREWKPSVGIVDFGQHVLCTFDETAGVWLIWLLVVGLGVIHSRSTQHQHNEMKAKRLSRKV